MYDYHAMLFEYPKVMKSTDIAAIEITDEGIVMTTRKSGCRFICPNKDKRVYPLEILNFDGYEQHELDLLMPFIRPNAVIFDVGANMGWYSITLAKYMPKTQIYAFEPIKKTYEYLKKNIDLNGVTNITPFNFGFSDTNKTSDFYYYPEGSGNASLVNVSNAKNIEKLSCAVKRMDDFVTSEHCHVDVMKCDVEGAELFVFQGGIKTIERDTPVIFSEILRKWSKKFHYHPNEIVRFFEKLGYVCYSVHKGKLNTFDQMDDQTQDVNFIFLHKMNHAHMIYTLV
jgi:FkbM family methyltransferase